LIPQLATITDTLGPRLARNGLEFRLESRHYPHLYRTHHLLSSSTTFGLYTVASRAGMSCSLAPLLLHFPHEARQKDVTRSCSCPSGLVVDHNVILDRATLEWVPASLFPGPQSASRSESRPPLICTSFAPHHTNLLSSYISSKKQSHTHPHFNLLSPFTLSTHHPLAYTTTVSSSLRSPLIRMVAD
jgi:hypothetical protein